MTNEQKDPVSSQGPIDKYKKKLDKTGIQAFFILTQRGLPIIERYYTNPEELGIIGTEAHAMSSMMTTLAKFAMDLSVVKMVSDVGILTSRLYFDFLNDMLFVLVYDEQRLLKYRHMDIQTLLKGCVSSVKDVFQAFLGDELSSGDPNDLYNFREEFGDFKYTVDSLLYSTYKELVEMLDMKEIDT